MEHQVVLKKLLRVFRTVSVFSVLASATMVNAQTPADKPASSDPLSGKFEGIVISTPGVDSRLMLEITNTKGKLSGRFITPQGASQISGDVALVRHHLTAETNNNSVPGKADLFILLVWQKQKGQWKLLARQAVKVPVK